MKNLRRMPEQNKKRTVRIAFVRIPDSADRKPSVLHETACGLTRFVIGKYWADGPETLVFGTGENGKPYLPEHPEICFNWSHSGSYIVTAVCGVPVGIDIQEMKSSDVGRLAGKILNPQEVQEFLQSDDPRGYFFREWVLKESYVKWTGEGLTRSLQQLPMDGWPAMIEIDKEYMCAIRADAPLDIRMEEVLWQQIRK